MYFYAYLVYKGLDGFVVFEKCVEFFFVFCYPRTLTESGRIPGMSFKCSFYTNIARFIVSLPPCTLKRNEVIIYIAASLVQRYIH